ncbi:MAG: leucine--tRNA ligase [Myxococcales bacterium]|nr:leucine--tRNA ligase [Myxococcales bacterium]
MLRLDHAHNDRRWQEQWEASRLFEADEDGADNIFLLDMPPYPSASGLHVGHVVGYTATDITARFLRLRGHNVLNPMGWDAFGLPAENFAIRTGLHPAESTRRSIATFKRQIKSLGLSYDWTREYSTSDPAYYRWSQWLFLKLLEHDLAYQANVAINWCPNDRTGLANEEVIDGRCERCGARIERRMMRQWMVRITRFADRLIAELDREDIDWPASTRALCQNWVGRRRGAKITFQTDLGPIEAFTTTPHWLYSTTFVAVSPSHPILDRLSGTPEVTAYRTRAGQRGDIARLKSHNAVRVPVSATHPLTGRAIPIVVAEAVLESIGTGAMIGVPADSPKDARIATAANLGAPVDRHDAHRAALARGDAAQLPPIEASDDADTMFTWLEHRDLATGHVSFRLRDWNFSRQRYWGAPFPIVHCDHTCDGPVPVPIDQLPVVLPDLDDYRPADDGQSPLARAADWVQTTCPRCGGPGRRETATMTSSASPIVCWLAAAPSVWAQQDEGSLWNPERLDAWQPIDMTVAGVELATVHLMYGRFLQMFLSDIGVASAPVLFRALRHPGLIMARTFRSLDGQRHNADGVDDSGRFPRLKDSGERLLAVVEKMSKSKLNTVSPDAIIQTMGADVLRVYVMMLGGFHKPKVWDARYIRGAQRFLSRVWRLAHFGPETGQDIADDEARVAQRNALIRRVTRALQTQRYHTAIASLMSFSRTLLTGASLRDLEVLTLLLSPFAPHLAEAVWETLGHEPFAASADWPSPDAHPPRREHMDIVVQVNGRKRAKMRVEAQVAQEQLESLALEIPNVRKFVSAGRLERTMLHAGWLLNFIVR